MRFAFLALVLVTAGPVLAGEPEDSSAAKAAVLHYGRGMDALAGGRYQEAILELRRAFALRRRPAVLVDLASAYEQAGERELAASTYEKYVRIAHLEPSLKEEMRARIARLRSAASTPTPGADGEERVLAPVPYAHQVPEKAAADQPLELRVQAPVDPRVKLYLSYQMPGEARYRSIEMKRHRYHKVAVIPGVAVHGKSLQYFIEARNVVTGAVVFRAGSRGSPNLVFIE